MQTYTHRTICRQTLAIRFADRQTPKALQTDTKHTDSHHQVYRQTDSHHKVYRQTDTIRLADKLSLTVRFADAGLTSLVVSFVLHSVFTMRA